MFLTACEFLEIDKCLDRGGKWSYEEEKCVFEEITQFNESKYSNNEATKT